MNIDPNTFDHARAWTLRDAANSGKLNVYGKHPSVQMVQRWAMKHGPRLILATVRIGRELFTMPEWVDAYVLARTAAQIGCKRRAQAA